jgi:hypothetical protein
LASAGQGEYQHVATEKAIIQAMVALKPLDATLSLAEAFPALV